jgi:hypothetical protein
MEAHDFLGTMEPWIPDLAFFSSHHATTAAAGAMLEGASIEIRLERVGKLRSTLGNSYWFSFPENDGLLLIRAKSLPIERVFATPSLT